MRPNLTVPTLPFWPPGGGFYFLDPPAGPVHTRRMESDNPEAAPAEKAKRRVHVGDRRKKSARHTPKRAKQISEAARMRKVRKTTKTEEKLKEKTKELSLVERKVNNRKELLAMMERAPSVAQQRKILFSMFEEEEFNPIAELIAYAKDKDIPREERIKIVKDLASFYQPKPRTVDIQADVKGNLSISMIDFRNAIQAELVDAEPSEPPVVDAEYEEFLSPEEELKDAGG